MQAAFSSGSRRLTVRSVPEPAPAADEVVLCVRACGICGSDLHWFAGGAPPPAVCPGHEIAGEVVGCGAAVTAVAAGMRVTAEPMATCGACRWCRAGTPQLCRGLRIAGMHRPGGFAELVALPAAMLHPLPADLDWAVAALSEPMAVAVHATRLAGIGAGQRVLVLGAGAIGLLAVVAARAAGAADVWVTARHPHQQSAARRLGATRVFGTDARAGADRRALARDHDIDAVLETVGGVADTLADAVHCVRPGGTVIVLGVFTAPPPLPATSLLVKEVRLIGSMMYDRSGPRPDFATATDLLVAHRDAVAPLVTHRYALADVQQAFETAADKHTGAIKVSVLP
jgi:2-desacetyl-2-hydroxyethyl bacteriochlorophyllide A dehydrogenase